MKPHPVRWLLALLFSTWSVTLGQSPTLLFDAPVVIGDSQTRFRAALHYDSDAFADLVSVWFPTDSSILVRGYRGDGAGNFFGGALLVTVTSTFPIQLGGTPGVPGVGSMIIPFTVPPSVALTSAWLQVGLFDGAAPAGISGTNGCLRLEYGL